MVLKKHKLASLGGQESLPGQGYLSWDLCNKKEPNLGRIGWWSADGGALQVEDKIKMNLAVQGK